MPRLQTMRSQYPERRAHPRFPFVLDIDMRKLPLVFSPQEPLGTVRGRLQNISRGGLCILTEEGLNGAAVMVCEITVPELPVPIPALTTIRWSEPRGGTGEGHLYGLQFCY